MSQNHTYPFNEQHLLHVLKHYLPTQGPLKDFVHHNTLHAFQDMKFYDAIFKASAIFGYQTTFSLAEYRDLYSINLDNTVQPILFRILVSYMDQGIAISSFPFEDKGLLNPLRSLEDHSLVS